MKENVINMKFSLGDKAFVVKDDAVFSCDVIEINFSQDEKRTYKNYVVERTIPRGLFDEDMKTEAYEEDELFLDKKEAKEFLSNLKEARKVVNKYDGKQDNLASLWELTCYGAETFFNK